MITGSRWLVWSSKPGWASEYNTWRWHATDPKCRAGTFKNDCKCFGFATWQEAIAYASTQS